MKCALGVGQCTFSRSRFTSAGRQYCFSGPLATLPIFCTVLPLPLPSRGRLVQSYKFHTVEPWRAPIAAGCLALGVICAGSLIVLITNIHKYTYDIGNTSLSSNECQIKIKIKTSIGLCSLEHPSHAPRMLVFALATVQCSVSYLVLSTHPSRGSVLSIVRPHSLSILRNNSLPYWVSSASAHKRGKKEKESHWLLAYSYHYSFRVYWVSLISKWPCTFLSDPQWRQA